MKKNVPQDESIPVVESSAIAEYPEGGYGWIIVISSFMVHVIAIGTAACFGVFQQYYINQNIFPGSSVLAISFIGSIMVSGLPLCATPSGLLADRFGYRLMIIIGGFGMLASLVLASFSTELYHLIITQGLLFGVFSSISYIPAISILAQYFDKRRGMATGLAVSGSGFGGFALSPLLSFLIQKLGWRWALRLNGIIGGFVVILAGCFMKSRVQSGTSKLPRFSLLKDGFFLRILCIPAFAVFGYFVPFFYLPTYAAYYGLNISQGALIVGLLNLASAIGRIAWGFSSDFVGCMNTLVICLFVSSLSTVLIWPFSTTFATITIYAFLYGFFIGGFISLFPTIIANFYAASGDLGGVMGMAYSGYFFGNLFGSPIAGILIDKYSTNLDNDEVTERNFLPVMIYSAGFLFIGVLFLLSIRYTVSKKIFVKV